MEDKKATRSSRPNRADSYGLTETVAACQSLHRSEQDGVPVLKEEEDTRPPSLTQKLIAN